MILSQQHKFIFVAVPHTGSSAIEKELVSLYGGTPVRDKHSLPFFIPRKYRHFRVIGGVRHPLADLISTYFKYKTDHGGLYSAHIDGTLENRFMSKRDIAIYQQVANGMSLGDYISHKTKVPSVPRVALGPRPYDFVYRTEYLDTDFPEMLGKLGIEMQRPLPKRNPTEKSEEAGLAMEQFAKHPGVSVACHTYGYSDVMPSAQARALYHAARLAKQGLFALRTLRSLTRTQGAYDMSRASIDADEELGNIH